MKKTCIFLFVCLLLHSQIIFSITQLPSLNTKIISFKRPKPVVVEVIPKTPRKTIALIHSLMLIYYGSLGCALPYIPIYYRYLGLSDHAIGLLGAITPAITFLVSPLWGILADSTGKYKEIMILTFILSVVIRYGLISSYKNIYYISTIITLSAIFNAPVKPLMDSAVMDLLSDKNDYGKSRFFGQVGFGLGSYLVGPIVHSASTIYEIFNAHAAWSILSLGIMVLFKPRDRLATPNNSTIITNENIRKKPEIKKSNFFSVLKEAFQDSDVSIFFFIIFFIGVSSGIIENFAYVRMAEISGKNKHVLGLSRLLSSLAGGPMFWLSGRILQALGIDIVLTISLTSYFIRFMVYATMTNPWQALPAEILRGITFALFWTAATSFVYKTSPKGATATMLGLLNGMYGGLGQSVGAIIGGSMSRRITIKRTFYIAGLADLVGIVLFILYQIHKYYQKDPIDELTVIESVDKKI